MRHLRQIPKVLPKGEEARHCELRCACSLTDTPRDASKNTRAGASFCWMLPLFTLNLDPPPFDTGRPLSSNRLCPLSSMHRLQKARQNQSLRLSSLGLHPGSRWSPMSAVGGGLISSRTARGVRMNLVLAMVFQRHVRRKAVLFPATRAQAAEAGLLLHKLASSWLRGEASMDSCCLRAG